MKTYRFFNGQLKLLEVQIKSGHKVPVFLILKQNKCHIFFEKKLAGSSAVVECSFTMYERSKTLCAQ